MKKVISIMLAALMLMSCFSVASFARGVKECKCPEGVHVENQPCKCCVYCDNFDDTYLLECCNPETGEFCCADCNGVYDAKNGCGCRCGCEYCELKDQTGNENDSKLDDIWDEQDKNNFVDGFQAIIKKLSDFFDDLFNKIFEFLKIDGVIGKGDK